MSSSLSLESSWQAEEVDILLEELFTLQWVGKQKYKSHTMSLEAVFLSGALNTTGQLVV